MDDKSLYIFVNSFIELEPGQVAAQVAHITGEFGNFGNIRDARVIVLNANDDIVIRNIYDYATEHEYAAAYYIEAGTDSIPSFTLTVGAVYLPTAHGKKLFADFQLYAESKDIARNVVAGPIVVDERACGCA